ncbi:MAG: response regulator, partial [Rudaea sp.]
MIRTLLVDDHAIVRTGFRALIEREMDMAIAGECASLAEADVVLDGGAVDVLVLDISLRGGSGLAAVPDLRARYPALRIVMLSMLILPPLLGHPDKRFNIAIRGETDDQDESGEEAGAQAVQRGVQ